MHRNVVVTSVDNFRAGFVIGAVSQSVFNVADVMYFTGSVGAAVWNALLAASINYP